MLLVNYMAASLTFFAGICMLAYGTGTTTGPGGPPRY